MILFNLINHFNLSVLQYRELTIFSKMLEVSRIHQNLKETLQTLTVLAPADFVFQRFPNDQLRRILNDETLSKGKYTNMTFKIIILFLFFFIHCSENF